MFRAVGWIAIVVLVGLVGSTTAVADETGVSIGLSQVTEAYQELPGGYAPYSDLSDVFGTGSIIGLSLSCTGSFEECAGDRPVELREVASGKAVVVQTGTIAEFLGANKPWEDYRELKQKYPLVDTSRPAKLTYRWYLAEWNGHPAAVSNPASFEVRRATRVRVTVRDGTWEPYGYAQGVLHYCVRRINDKIPMITLRISPAQAGREGFYEYGEGDRVVAERLLSTKQGVFRFAGPKDHADSRIIRAMATAKLAGFSVTFDPCSPFVTGP